jgi:chromosome segregation ATPase
LCIDLVCKFVENKQHGNTTLLGGWHLHRFGSGYGCSGLLRLDNRKEQTMTHSLYLSIIGAVVFFAAYIILRLLRDNERLMAELDDAKAEARTLDTDLDEARRSNGQATEKIRHLNFQVEVLSKRLAEYNNETKAWEIRCNIVDTEYRKTIQQLYGRIGAMQRKINRLKSLP